MKCRHFFADLLKVTAGAADTEFTVIHNLNTVPRGCFVVRRNQAAQLYESGTAWTNTTAYLKSDTGSAQFYVVFVG